MNENRKTMTSDDVLLLICGELDPERANEVRSALAADAALRAEAAALEGALRAASEQRPAVSDGFNEELRRRLDAPRATPHRGLRLWRFVSAGLAAAAVIVFTAILFWSPGPSGERPSSGGGGVVWADVVHAMNQIEHCHITVFNNEPRESDPSRRLFRLDLYYQHPDRWRSHGVGQVRFQTGDEARIFSIKDRRFLEPNAARVGLIPGDFAEQFRTQGMLHAILFTLFEGKVPTGEPVKSDAAADGAGIEVFDYTHDSATQWVRLWVLRESRLPIRMNVYQPDSDRAMVVVFDYAETQPAAFFDATAFEQAAKSVYFDRPEQYYNLGQAPIDKKPQTAQQVFEAKGVRPPKVQQAVATRDHHLLLVTDEPHNKNIYGGSIPAEYYSEAQDNWGNLYVRYYGTGGDSNYYHYYLPVPPFRSGEDKQKVTFLYTAWNHHLGLKEAGGRDVVLHRETVDVPPPSSDGIPAGWPNPKEMPFFRDQALRSYLSTTSPLEALRGADRLLAAATPDGNVKTLKLQSLQRLSNDETADAYFESEIKPAAIKDAVENGRIDLPLSSYLKRKLEAGQTGEIMPLIEQVRAAQQRRLGEAAREERRLEDLKREFDRDPAKVWLALPEAMARVEELKPSIGRVVRSRDGNVVFELLVKSVGEKQPQWSEQTPSVLADGAAWQYASTLYLPGNAKGPARLVVGFRGAGGTLPLKLMLPVIVAGEDFVHLKVPARMEVALPAATVATADEARQAFDLPGDKPSSEPYAVAHRRAGKLLYQDKNYAAALEAYRAALALPDAIDPSERNSPEVLAALRRRDRFDARIAIAECLIQLGRVDEALVELDKLEQAMPGADGAEAWFHDWQEMWILTKRALAAGHLIDAGRLDEAKAILDRANQKRPDFRTLPNLHEWQNEPWGTSGLQRRYHTAQRWASIDRAMWKLEQARSANASLRPGGG